MNYDERKSAVNAILTNAVEAYLREEDLRVTRKLILAAIKVDPVFYQENRKNFTYRVNCAFHQYINSVVTQEELTTLSKAANQDKNGLQPTVVYFKDMVGREVFDQHIVDRVLERSGSFSHHVYLEAEWMWAKPNVRGYKGWCMCCHLETDYVVANKILSDVFHPVFWVLD